MTILGGTYQSAELDLGTLVSIALVLGGSLGLFYGIALRFNLDVDWAFPSRWGSGDSDEL